MKRKKIIKGTRWDPSPMRNLSSLSPNKIIGDGGRDENPKS